MPILTSTYAPRFLYKNSHFNTAYKTLFYKETIQYNRKRIDTPDGDFLDLDFSQVGSETLVIALHGLEGSSSSKYIISLSNFLNQQGIDVFAYNSRGCSGEDNRFVASYHSGKTDDVATVLTYVLQQFDYKHIVLVGYSMGGNITLKFLAEHGHRFPSLKGGVGVSVPCDLEGASYELAKWHNTLYLSMFMKSLRKKALDKLEKFPTAAIDKSAIEQASTFEDFDNAVTAPLFGYDSAQHYWRSNSSKQFISAIEKPALILNAADDTFLATSCYPTHEASQHTLVNLEIPAYGGHVGFNGDQYSSTNDWSERRILHFIHQICT